MYLLPCGICETEELFGFKVMDLLIRFRPNDHIVYREEEDGAFLFDPKTGNLKYMNRSAKEIYLMLNGYNDTDTVIQNLDELYPDAGLNPGGSEGNAAAAPAEPLPVEEDIHRPGLGRRVADLERVVGVNGEVDIVFDHAFRSLPGSCARQGSPIGVFIRVGEDSGVAAIERACGNR